tara:strand:+ start:3172 stop:3366 length:195 start_codon:yes stop_codon:yes gene_type:complete
MTKEKDIASLLYNLEYNKKLNINNYCFKFDNENLKVINILFINEEKIIVFSDITSIELYKFFNF